MATDIKVPMGKEICPFSIFDKVPLASPACRATSVRLTPEASLRDLIFCPIDFSSTGNYVSYEETPRQGNFQWTDTGSSNLHLIWRAYGRSRRHHPGERAFASRCRHRRIGPLHRCIFQLANSAKNWPQKPRIATAPFRAKPKIASFIRPSRPPPE